MSVYTGTNEWRESIYIVDEYTPIIGGEPEWDGDSGVGGFSNISAAQLTNRTNYLKVEVDQVNIRFDNELGEFSKKDANLSDLPDVQQARYNLGLNLVDNTRDILKPVSTPQQEALDLKVDKTTTVTGEGYLSGGGELGGNVSIDVSEDTKSSLAKADTSLQVDNNLSDLGDIEIAKTTLGLDGKQDTLSAGDNITIVGNVISAEATEYPLVSVEDLLGGVSEVESVITSNNVSEYSNFSPLVGEVIEIDFNEGRNFSIDSESNLTFDNPINAKSGYTGDIVISSSSELTLSFGSVWKFSGGDAPIVEENTSTVISYKVVSPTSIVCGYAEDLQ